MKIVRVTAVGLAIAVMLMNLVGSDFAPWWLNHLELRNWLEKLPVGTPSSSSASASFVAMSSWAVVCLAIGLYVAGTAYSMLEDFVVDTADGILEATAFLLELAVRGTWRLVVKAVRRRTMVQS